MSAVRPVQKVDSQLMGQQLSLSAAIRASIPVIRKPSGTKLARFRHVLPSDCFERALQAGLGRCFGLLAIFLGLAKVVRHVLWPVAHSSSLICELAQLKKGKHTPQEERPLEGV